MSMETADLAVIQELIDAGILTENDVMEHKTKDRDNAILGTTAGKLHGGSGDDLLIGVDGVANTFFIDGRDRGNDEGRHVDVIQNFKIGEDTLGFRLDGGYFKTDGGDGDFYNGPAGDKLEQSRNGNQASFSSASDLADLLLHVNTRATVDNRSTGTTKKINGFTMEQAESGVELTKANATKQVIAVEDNSYVKVVGDNIVLNIDDYKHSEDHYDKWGNLKTTDKTIVLEDFEAQLASEFAKELGFDEFKSKQDSVHILGQDGDYNVSGGDGDNLYIMSAQADVVYLSRESLNNDENQHVNILHGFDLETDGIKLSTNTKGQFADGANGGKFKTFYGAAGIAEIIANSGTTNVEERDGNLIIQINLRGGTSNASGRDPMTIVLTDTTLDDVYEAAQKQIFEQLTDAEVFPVGSIPPAPGGNGDGIIFDGNDNKGDDIFIATSEADTFFFDSRDGAEDGTGGTNDRAAHVNVVVGFGAEDTLSFRIDGGFFKDLAESLPEVDVRGNNKATVTYEGIDELGDYLNTLGGDNAAFYDAETNSTILTIDDSPSNPNDNISVVLWDSGDIL